MLRYCTLGAWPRKLEAKPSGVFSMQPAVAGNLVLAGLDVYRKGRTVNRPAAMKPSAFPESSSAATSTL